MMFVNDCADTRREFCSQSGRFLLLDRVDKPPQIDSGVLNRDREHHRTPRLCGNGNATFFRNSQSSGVVREGSFLVALANACKIFAQVTMPDEFVALDIGHALDSVVLQHRGDVAERSIWVGGNDPAPCGHQ